MKRRLLLNIVALGASLPTTGCIQSGEQETASTEPNENSSTDGSTNQTVSVTKRVESQSGLKQSLNITNGGNLSYELTCSDGTQKNASGSVTGEKWTAFKQAVVNLDRDELQNKYECQSQCPRDIPPQHIQITINGSTVSTVIEAYAKIPSELNNIVSKITAFEEKIQKPTCE